MDWRWFLALTQFFTSTLFIWPTVCFASSHPWHQSIRIFSLPAITKRSLHCPDIALSPVGSSLTVGFHHENAGQDLSSFSCDTYFSGRIKLMTRRMNSIKEFAPQSSIYSSGSLYSKEHNILKTLVEQNDSIEAKRFVYSCSVLVRIQLFDLPGINHQDGIGSPKLSISVAPC